jgi:hypothetical protein
MPRQKIPPETPRDPGEVTAELRELLEGARADRVELQTKIVNGDLLPLELFSGAFGRIMAVYASRINVLDMSAGDIIASVLGLPAHDVRGIIADMQYEPMRYIQKELINFIENE